MSIVASVGSMVLDNTARSNGRFGLLLTGAGYGSNVLSGNAGEFENPNTQVMGGIQMGHNVCNGGPCS